MKDKMMTGNESTNVSAYSGPMQDDVYSLFDEDLEEHKEGMLVCPFDDRYEKVVFAFLNEAHKHTKQNVYPPVFVAIKPTVVEVFFTREPSELLGNKLYTVAEFQDCVKCFVRLLKKVSTFTAAITAL